MPYSMHSKLDTISMLCRVTCKHSIIAKQINDLANKHSLKHFAGNQLSKVTPIIVLLQAKVSIISRCSHQYTMQLLS